MRKRILCPNPEHNEQTPSFVLYEEYGNCFGCGYRMSLKDLGIEQEREPVPREKEDISKTLDYVSKLPLKTIRGLSLPCDDKYYYILFPGYNFYKKRAYTDEGSRYLCPTGHSKPLYVARKSNQSNTLAIVEGELNAASLALINPPYDVVSPGPATDFYSKNADKYMNYYLTTGYKKYIIVVDKDAAGCKAAIELKSRLMKHTPYIEVRLLETDYNEILQNYGTEGLKKYVGL